MENNKTSSRRKFVFGLGILSIFGALTRPATRKKVIIGCAPASEKKTVKMLTQDGTLVEVEEKMLKGEGDKITDEGLQSWVKRT